MSTILSEADILVASILIVDDQEANVMLLQQMLADAGFTQVQSTTNPREVCALHRKEAYDLILLDLQMPGMDGFQVMAGLKTDLADAYLPVIVITAQPGHKLRALLAGARDFISKPFDIVECKTRIRNMLEVRLLYRKLEVFNVALDRLVRERTAELRESEARYRSLTELATDWYWEQDQHGQFIRMSGPVLDMLGIRVDSLAAGAGAGTGAGPGAGPGGHWVDGQPDGWSAEERAVLRAAIDARQPFLDVLLTRTQPDGSRQQFRVSGEPMFNESCSFLGYRGVGVEVPVKA
jgi:CheY-like chemotaxis protein